MKSEYALVRPVPASYDKCIRTNRENIDVQLAIKQHEEYCRALKKLGLKLIWVKRDDSLPDSCFIEDTAVVFDGKAIICNMKVKSRREEVNEVAKTLRNYKNIQFVRFPATIDGGDVLKIDDKVFIGLTSRTNRQAVNQLEKILEGYGLKIIPVKVRGVLHLKSACTYLGNNCVALAKGNFDINILKGYNKLIVPCDEAYAANFLSVNGKIIMAKGYTKTKKLVEKMGFDVKELDISEFRKGDGALTCLSIIW